MAAGLAVAGAAGFAVAGAGATGFAVAGAVGFSVDVDGLSCGGTGFTGGAAGTDGPG